MTRPQLLRETQRAAGNANLTNWHDTLIESGKELKVMQEVQSPARVDITVVAETVSVETRG